MKTIKFSTLLLGLSMLLFASCVRDDDFELPNVAIKKVAFDGKIISLAEAVKNSTENVQTYKKNEAIEGYVISSDQGGNYYEKIYIQTLDGKDGFSVAIKKSGLFSEYPLGTKVQVRLKGATVQIVNGKLEVGAGIYTDKYGNEHVGKMAPAIYTKSVINTGKSVEIASIAHIVTSLKDLDKDEFINRLIIVKNVAFETSVVGKPYHQKKNDARFGSDYTILDKTGGELTFRTSKFAKYATKLVPKEIVNITGVLTKYKKYYQFMVNRYEDIEILEGTNGADIANTGGGSENPDYTPKVVTELNETFKTVKVAPKGEKPIAVNLEGWANVIEKGDRNWIGKSYNKNPYAQVSGYKAKSKEIIAWLVTPGLDLGKAKNKNFSFDSKRQFSKDETLEVLISSDFKGDVKKATWKKLDGYKLAPKDSKYGKTANSGNIDLSSYNGVVYIAFKYVGNNSDKSGTFQIDNVKFNYVPDSNGGNEYKPKVVTKLDETFEAVKVAPKGKAPIAINLEGWTNIKAEGDRDWIGKEYNKNKYAQVSGFKAKSNEIVAWLVTPGLDLANAQNKNFSFDSKRQFSKDETLEVLISSDFKGDATKATWKKLDGYQLAKKDNKYGKTVNSGNIDLSSYNGIVYIAFKYIGNNSDKSGTFQIDNVKFNYTASTENGEDVSLTIDKTDVNVKVGETQTIKITKGNGDYKVVSSDEAIATATENNGEVTVTGKTEGNTEITVTDTKTKETKKITVTVTKKSNTTPPPSTTQNSLFPGADFEDWETFKKSLNKYGVQKYATQSSDGKDGSKALHIKTEKGKNPKKNAYVFTATVPDNFDPKGKSKITFYIKGTCAEKTLSINLYKEDGKYYPFNLGVCESDKTLSKTSQNSYTGRIDTKGKWVKVTLNIADLEGIATSKGKSLFALKIGVAKKKGTDWDLLIDNITIE